jgi:hypothetical protein
VFIFRFLLTGEFWGHKSWIWDAHEVLLLSPKARANPWSESGDREGSLDELTHGS